MQYLMYCRLIIHYSLVIFLIFHIIKSHSPQKKGHLYLSQEDLLEPQLHISQMLPMSLLCLPVADLYLKHVD